LRSDAITDRVSETALASALPADERSKKARAAKRARFFMDKVMIGSCTIVVPLYEYYIGNISGEQIRFTTDSINN